MKMVKKERQKKGNRYELHGKKKVQYIWDYYKLPIIVLCIFFYIIGYVLYGRFTYKETMLYTALVNVSASDSLDTQLSAGFLDYIGKDKAKNNFQLYTGLYLTTDESNPYHEYTYASQMKILAAIESSKMDVVLMNKEAFDAFSQNGYLCNLSELLSSDSDLYVKLEPYLVTNIVILEDNILDLQFDSNAEYHAVTREYPMALDMSAMQGILKDAGFDDAVYLGIIENSPRKELSVSYIQYLLL